MTNGQFPQSCGSHLALNLKSDDLRQMLLNLHMNDSNLYAKILGLRKPWRVLGVTVCEALKAVTLFVRPEPGHPLRCPHCRQICPGYDSRTRRWRHLDSCDYQTWIEADVPRVQCPEHGCVQIASAGMMQCCAFAQALRNVHSW